MSIKDGGSAFPHKRISHMTAVPVDDYPFAPSRAEPVYEDAPGLSVRDYFAGQVCSALIDAASRRNIEALPGEVIAATIARQSYEMADFMLAERAKQDSADD